MLFSHPGVKLINHLNGVLRIGMDTYRNKKGLQLPFKSRKIEMAFENMLFFHDIGKATSYFQKYLSESVNNGQVTVPKDLRAHSLVSSVYTGMKTFKETESNVLSLLVFEAVKKHHGDLENFKDMVTIDKKNRRNLQKIWDALDFNELNIEKEFEFSDVEDFIDDFLWEIDEEVFSEEYFFLLNFFFSILTYADKTEVIFHDSHIENKRCLIDFTNFVSNYKINKFSDTVKDKLNTMREEIYLTAETALDFKNRIFSLNVPTGGGKTLAVLNVAFKMLSESEEIERIIYALPFLSIVDQTVERIKEIFELNNEDHNCYLTVHHHLIEASFKIQSEEFGGEKALFLIENWDTPLIVTTFWQLFNSILTNKNSQLRKFHNIANSIIIMDEVQTLQYIYWDVIKNVFRTICRMFNVRVILMTATMPMIFEEKKKEIFPLINVVKRDKYFNFVSRYRISKLNNLRTINIEELTIQAIKDLKNNPEKDFLFVFNTIKSSILFFRNLKEYFSKENIIYLSTNIIPMDRIKRIKRIKTLEARKIVVSTQLIEAGVDIDLDVVYRDFAPLDNIIQTAGRCNRNDYQKGILYLFVLKREEDSTSEDVYYIYPRVALIPTKEIFDDIVELDERGLLPLVSKYFERIKHSMSKEKFSIIKKNIHHLEYENIVKNFELMKNISATTIFIEKDDRASKILEDFRKILDIENRFERKNEFLKIRKDFYSYTLSVKTQTSNINWDMFQEIGYFKILYKDMIPSFYDEDIGFMYKDYDFL